MEKRRFPRYSTRFPTVLTLSGIPQGDGQVVNLSLGGCCINTPLNAKPGTVFGLQVRVADTGSPIQVDRALVQWSLTTYLGLEFVGISPDDEVRLQQVIAQLAQQPGLAQ
jgi:hypothetical protein